MANKEIRGVRIKFRRDTEQKYGSSFIPLNGEICLVDTNNGLKFKVGDGDTNFNLLPFVDEDHLDKFSVLQGYYYNNKFYKESSYTTELVEKENKVYIDVITSKLYYYSGSEFHENAVSIPDATASQPGVMKIYTTQGNNADGAVTQKFFTETLNNLILTVDDDDPECLVLEKL